MWLYITNCNCQSDLVDGKTVELFVVYIVHLYWKTCLNLIIRLDECCRAVMIENEDGRKVILSASNQTQREAIAKRLLTPSTNEKPLISCKKVAHPFTKVSIKIEM